MTGSEKTEEGKKKFILPDYLLEAKSLENKEIIKYLIL